MYWLTLHHLLCIGSTLLSLQLVSPREQFEQLIRKIYKDMLYGRLNMFVMKNNNSTNSGNYSTSLHYPISGDNYRSIRIIIKKNEISNSCTI